MLAPQDATFISGTTSKYINDIAPHIDGWFYPLDMMMFGMVEAFHRSLSLKGDVAEIGVWKGKSLTLLAMISSVTDQIYALDLFADDLLEQTQYNIGKFVSPEFASRISYIKGNTADYNSDYLRGLFKNKLRILHIDAGHEYHEVLHTLTLTAPLMQDHGIIVMDDYQDREFPGVPAATLDYCFETVKGRWVPFLAGANKMYLANPVYAKLLQIFLCKEAYFQNSFRLSRIKDSLVLIAQSKLPMKSAVIEQLIQSQLHDVIPEVQLTLLTEKARSLSQSMLEAERLKV